MIAPSVDHVFQVYTHRFLAEGVHYRDLLDLRERIPDMSEWCAAWSEFARAAEERADRAGAAGFAATAGSELVRAATYYFFAQFILWHDPSAKRTAYEASVRALDRAGRYLDPPLVRVRIPFGPAGLPGHLRLPRGAVRPPCVVLIGGLDTTKEEQVAISNLCLERGLATLAFDGPGQGEVFYRMPLTERFHECVSAALDHLETREDIDPARLGVVGRSLGSYYAAKSAALDRRIKAVVAWGGMYDLANHAALPDIIREGFLFVTGSRTSEEARAYFEGVSLAGLADRIACPLLVVHGGRDRITPAEQARRLVAEAKGRAELLAWPDGSHCAHDRSHVARPAIADFMLQHL